MKETFPTNRFNCREDVKTWKPANLRCYTYIVFVKTSPPVNIELEMIVVLDYRTFLLFAKNISSMLLIRRYSGWLVQKLTQKKSSQTRVCLLLSRSFHTVVSIYYVRLAFSLTSWHDRILITNTNNMYSEQQHYKLKWKYYYDMRHRGQCQRRCSLLRNLILIFSTRFFVQYFTIYWVLCPSSA